MRQKRFEKLALILAIFLGLWTLYFIYDTIGGMIRIRFFDPSHLPGHYGLEESEVTTGLRNSIFLAWLPTGIFGSLGFFCGFLAAYNVHKGRMFDPKALWPVSAIGVFTCLSIVANSLAFNYELSKMWPLTDRPPLDQTWYWGQADVTIFCFGIGFIFIGLIHIEVAKIVQENKEFI